MQFPGGERERRGSLLEKIAEAAQSGVDYIQLREKDLPARHLEFLAREAMERIRGCGGGRTRLLINSRTDVALAAGADGVHLRSRDISAQDVRRIWRGAGSLGEPIVAVSCHSEAEVAGAENAGADFVVFGPVFENKGGSDTRTLGLDLLRTVCQRRIGVFALGGVTAQNAVDCAEAGASGVAGIRLFQENPIAAMAVRFRE